MCGEVPVGGMRKRQGMKLEMAVLSLEGSREPWQNLEQGREEPEVRQHPLPKECSPPALASAVSPCGLVMDKFSSKQKIQPQVV